MKNKIDPRHAELFEEMFGANAKGENVEIPTEYQKQIEKANAPLPLRYIDAFFTLLINIVCKFIPIILIFGLVLNDLIKNDYNYFGFKSIFNLVFHEFTIFYPVLFFALKVSDPTPTPIKAEMTMKTNFFGTRDICTELLPLMKPQGESD